MKKLTAVLLTLLLILSLVGCSETAPSEPSGEEKTPEIRTEEKLYYNGDAKIYGVLYLPEEVRDTYPVVILSHGFGVTHGVVDEYAQYFAQRGFAAYAFDYPGGGSASQSDGDLLHMSVLTEAGDLNAVIDGILGESFTQKENLFLMGESQGGFVSSYVAAQRPEDVRALMLLYPAYVICDEALKRDHDPDTMPETETLMGTTVGKIYTLDAASFDIYDVIGSYTGDVLILHGTKDPLVPLSYSEKAVETFSSAVLETVEGAGHGFTGKNRNQAKTRMADFAEEHLS